MTADNEDRTSEEELDDLDTEVEDREDDSTDSENGAEEQDPKILAKRYKDTQAAYTKASQERADLKRQVEALQTQVNTVIQMSGKDGEKKTPSNPFAFLDDESVQEKLLDDPKNIAQAMKQLLYGVAEMVDARDKAFISRIESVDPSVRTMRDKIAELKQDPDYRDFSDSQLAVIAKKQTDKKVEKEEEEDNYQGPMGNGRRIVRNKSSDKDSAEEKAINYWMSKIGYDRFDNKD